MKKILGTVAIVIILLVVIVAIIAADRLDGIVKMAVTAYGSQITKVSVAVDDVHVMPLSGAVKVKGFVLGNPEGYQSPDAIRVGTMSAGVNLFSLLSDKIVVRSIVLESPEITFEGGPGGNNLDKILDNVKDTQQKGVPVVTRPAAKPKRAKKLEVDDFLITGTKVHVHLTGFGGQEATIPLPDIHLTDLGRDANGITASDLSRRVLDAIVTSTLKAVAGNVANLGKSVGQLKNGGTGVINKLKRISGGLFKK